MSTYGKIVTQSICNRASHTSQLYFLKAKALSIFTIMKQLLEKWSLKAFYLYTYEPSAFEKITGSSVGTALTTC